MNITKRLLGAQKNFYRSSTMRSTKFFSTQATHIGARNNALKGDFGIFAIFFGGSIILDSVYNAICKHYASIVPPTPAPVLLPFVNHIKSIDTDTHISFIDAMFNAASSSSKFKIVDKNHFDPKQDIALLDGTVFVLDSVNHPYSCTHIPKVCIELGKTDYKISYTFRDGSGFIRGNDQAALERARDKHMSTIREYVYTNYANVRNILRNVNYENGTVTMEFYISKYDRIFCHV